MDTITLTKTAPDKMNTITFTKTAPPEWLLAMWKEIDDRPLEKALIVSQRTPYAISVLPIGMDARRSEKICAVHR